MRRFLLLLALLGCDPVVDKHTPDAAKAIDGAPDAPTHGMVSVKVYDPSNTGAVVVGVPVVFIEADGTLVGHPTTGADGVATADVHKDATATVVTTSQSNTQLLTVTGLVPGDTITLGPNSPSSTMDGTFTVSFPAYGGATTYRVFNPCGSGSSAASPQTLTLYSDCKTATMELMLVAYDQGNNPLAYIDKPNVAYSAGGNAALTGSYLSLNTFTGTFTNIDAGIDSLNLSRTVPQINGFSRGGGGTPMNGTLSVSVTGPLGGTAQVSSRVTKGRNTNEVVQTIGGNALTYGLDVGATILPWISQPTFDAPTHKLTVPVDMTGTTHDAPDLFYVELDYQRTVGTTTTSYNWLVFAANAGDVTLPALPPEVGDVMPQATDTVNTYGQMFEADTFNGWDAVRPDVYGFVYAIEGANSAATRLRFSGFSGT